MQGAIAEDESRFCRGLPLAPALSRREREKSGTHYLAAGSVSSLSIPNK